jgi:hypothetical protein
MAMRVFAVFWITVAALLAPSLSRAELITFRATGQLLDPFAPQDGAPFTAAAGDPFALDITYDTAAPDLAPESTEGRYVNALVSLVWLVNGVRFEQSMTALNEILVFDNGENAGRFVDALLIRGIGETSGTVLSLSTATLLASSALTSDALPTVAPRLDAFPVVQSVPNDFRYVAFTASNAFFGARIDTLESIPPIPLPASAWLFLTACALGSRMIREQVRT